MTAFKLARHVGFVAVHAGLVALYCVAMTGKLEPLKHEPTRFVTLPLTAITAMIAAGVYPLMARCLRLPRVLLLWLGLVLVSALYGLSLWVRFPDGSAFAIPMAVVGGPLYGWPVFLAALVVQSLWPWPAGQASARRSEPLPLDESVDVAPE